MLSVTTTTSQLAADAETKPDSNQSYKCCIFQCHIFKEIQWKVSVLKIDCQGKISEDFWGILLLVSTGTHPHDN